jgi:dihydrofolate reductase
MRLNLIYARARNGVIGRDNALPWHLPEDLAHFKRHTQGCPVIMGRKTWDSLPPRFRPLPGRLNAVLTRDPTWLATPQDSSTAAASPVATEISSQKTPLRFDSLESSLLFLENHPEVWVIGGAQLYAQALPLAQRVVVTEIDAEFEGDAWAPTLGTDWTETSRESHVAANGLSYSFITYTPSSTQKD